MELGLHTSTSDTLNEKPKLKKYAMILTCNITYTKTVHKNDKPNSERVYL